MRPNVPFAVAATATLVALTGACLDTHTAPPAEPGFEITVSPLSLSGVTEACYDLRVTNGPDGGGQPVWTRAGICSSDFGDGAGAITYVGTCDAQVGVDNTVLLTLVSLEDDDGPIAFSNPCPSGAPCKRSAPCAPNADTLVAFDLTIARPAQQGFFDVAVDLEDVFCSAKVDCVADAESGGGPLNLLYAPDGDTRLPTAVLAFACTAGLGADTNLYFADLAIECGAARTPLVIHEAPGNVYTTTSPAPAPLRQLATYRGLESLTDAFGTSWGKLYLNVALALDFAAANGPCDLVGTLTASDGPFEVPFRTPAGTIWPLIQVDVPLVSAANQTAYTCTRHPLGDDPSDGIWVDYTDHDTPVAFDDRAHDDGGLVVVDHRSPLTIAPLTPTVAPNQTQLFSATGGAGGYVFTVVAGGGTFSGALYTAPSAAGAATVRVTDALGQTAETTVAIVALAKVVFVTTNTYTGNLGGLAGADATCQSVADGVPALAGRTFKAWLSSSTVSAASRFTQATVPYTRTDGVVVADNWADLVDGTLDAPINRTETGATMIATRKAWTGTQTNGGINYPGSATNHCDDWTTSNPPANGGSYAGYVDRTTCLWTHGNPQNEAECGGSASTLPCSNGFSLFCFEQ